MSGCERVDLTICRCLYSERRYRCGYWLLQRSIALEMDHARMHLWVWYGIATRRGLNKPVLRSWIVGVSMSYRRIATTDQRANIMCTFENEYDALHAETGNTDCDELIEMDHSCVEDDCACFRPDDDKLNLKKMEELMISKRKIERVCSICHFQRGGGALTILLQECFCS